MTDDAKKKGAGDIQPKDKSRLAWLRSFLPGNSRSDTRSPAEMFEGSSNIFSLEPKRDIFPADSFQGPSNATPRLVQGEFVTDDDIIDINLVDISQPSSTPSYSGRFSRSQEVREPKKRLSGAEFYAEFHRELRKINPDHYMLLDGRAVEVEVPLMLDAGTSFDQASTEILSSASPAGKSALSFLYTPRCRDIIIYAQTGYPIDKYIELLEYLEIHPKKMTQNEVLKLEALQTELALRLTTQFVLTSLAGQHPDSANLAATVLSLKDYFGHGIVEPHMYDAVEDIIFDHLLSNDDQNTRTEEQHKALRGEIKRLVHIIRETDGVEAYTNAHIQSFAAGQPDGFQPAGAFVDPIVDDGGATATLFAENDALLVQRLNDLDAALNASNSSTAGRPLPPKPDGSGNSGSRDPNAKLKP